MKKTLSLLLAVLMIFSVCSVTLASAEEETVKYVTVRFYNWDMTEYVDEVKVIEAGTKFAGPVDAPVRATEEKDGLEYVYTFKGWAKLVNGTADESKLYYSQTFDYVTEDTQYIAVYSVEEREPAMTFWNLIEMIFSKFNMIFEYFFKIFG